MTATLSQQRTAQLSPERVGHITGSRVAAALGLNPYQSPDDLMRAMVREALGAPSEFTGNEATVWGHEHEADAVAAYEAYAGVTVQHAGDEQILVKHPDYPDLFAVTPDGLVGDDGMIEVKCPKYGKYTEIPDYYKPQVQLQLHCTGRQWTDFLIWRTPERAAELDTATLCVQRIFKDADWLDEHLLTLRAFIADYRETVADPELAKRHLEPPFVTRGDETWATFSSAWLDAARDLELAKREEAAARAALIGLADGANARGGGVRVERVTRRGPVQWPALLADQQLAEIDLDAYRTADSTYYRITKEDK